MSPVHRAAVLAVLLLALAGCTKDPVVVKALPHVDPMGPWFADTRHCWGYNMVTSVARTDLAPLVPPDWTFANPLAPSVRVLVIECPDQTVAFLTVPMRAGDASAPEAEYLLQTFVEGADRGGAPDDWSRMGASAIPATITVTDAADAVSIEGKGGWAVRAALGDNGEPGRRFERQTRYGAGDPVVQTWAEESAVLTTPLAVSSIAFGPGSVLSGAHVVPLHSGAWWGAYNAWYRTGWPPTA